MKTLGDLTTEILRDSPRKIWVIGKSGQLAKALADELSGSHWQTQFFSREDLNLEFPDKVPPTMDELLANHFRPEAIVIAAAYTQVDQAEKDFDLALRINARSVGSIARWCADLSIPLVHVSTDYVFDGKGSTPWKEDDATDPLNAYGRSKLIGEMEITQTLSRAKVPYLIFRTSWVYDHQGKNFLNTMLRLGQEREELKIVSDQIGAPTYSAHLAQGILCGIDGILKQNVPAGIYHLSNRGEISWYTFAARIFELARPLISLKVKQLVPIRTEDFPTPARRPGNSRFSLHKFQSKLNVTLPDWEEGLRECLARKTAN